jgi:hypothetical protein
MMHILDGQFKSDKCLIEAVGKEFTCHNCGLVYEIGDYLSIIPNAYMVSSRSDLSKSKTNMEIEAWLNEPHVKDGRENYDGDAIMKDLEMLNKAADVTNKFLENMLAKINKPTEPELPAEEPAEEESEPEAETSTEAQQVLQNCTVEGNVIKLPPDQLDRKVYADVKRALELIGGKWKGGKTYGFVFKTDPTELLTQIANGEKRNLKKEYQFFATPAALAERMVSMAELGETEGKGYGDILEPSAGQGAIVKAIHDATDGAVTVYCYELMDINRSILEKMPGVKLIGDDFMMAASVVQYDRIIANPPFTKNQDIDHILLMYKLLKPGGIMVTLSSPSWQYGSQKKQVEFREWLKNLNAQVHNIPEGAFKESGTSIRTILIKIKKPEL